MVFIIAAIALLGAYFWLSSSDAELIKNSMKPASIGEESEIMVVCDDDIWADTLGRAMKSVFSSPFPGLANREPYFKLKHVPPQEFVGKVRHFTNVIFLAPLNKEGATSSLVKEALGEENLRKTLSEESNYFIANQDVWAEDQTVVFFFDQGELALLSRLYDEKDRFLQFFYTNELKRFIERFKALGRNDKLEGLVRDRFGVDAIQVSSLYELKYTGDDFLWLHREDAEKSLNLTFHIYSANEAPVSQMALRIQDSLSAIYTPGPADSSYRLVELRFEELLPLEEYRRVGKEQVLVNRGMWRMENYFMAGPFVLYSFFNEEENKVLAVEGFVHHPTKEKRKFIRELEAIISTIQF